MQTIRGQEAIDIAETYNAPVYDAFYQTEVEVEEAKRFVQSGRSITAFVLENWPESDSEAEVVMLQRFHQALVKGNLNSARVMDVIASPTGQTRIHPAAATLAAERLVEQNRLEHAGASTSGSFYRMASNVYFKEEILGELRQMVCSDCAQLDLTQPFHETCLLIILDFLRNQPESLEALTEVRLDVRNNAFFGRIPLGNAPQFLSRGLDVAKSRWQSVLKTHKPEDEAHGSTPHQGRSTKLAGTQASQADGDGTGGVDDEDTIILTSGSASVASPMGRSRISKADLIHYLESVEIVDDTTEISQLKEQLNRLSGQLRRRDGMIEQLEHQRAQLQKQCDEMQDEMTTLVEAMQIARRRSRSHSDDVIDV